MRKADATGAQALCKHFALGSCSRGDKCEYAHDADQAGKAHIVGRTVARRHSGPRETPPVRSLGHEQACLLMLSPAGAPRLSTV